MFDTVFDTAYPNLPPPTHTHTAPLCRYMSIDAVDKLMEETQEAMDIQDQIGEILGGPMGDMVDDDEALAELEALDKADADALAAEMPVAPTDQVGNLEDQLPVAPTGTVYTV